MLSLPILMDLIGWDMISTDGAPGILGIYVCICTVAFPADFACRVKPPLAGLAVLSDRPWRMRQERSRCCAQGLQ